MELSEYTPIVTQRVLIMGLSGSGKSTLAASLAKKYRLHWLDIENASELLVKLPADVKKNINLIKIPDSASFPIAAQTIQKLFKDKKANICRNHGVIDCPNCKKDGSSFDLLDFNTLDPRKDVVVLDTLTQVGASFLAHLMKARPADAKPERDDWGGLRKNCEFLASNIQAAQFNLVCTAQTVEAEMEDKRLKLVPAFGSRDMSASVGAKFSAVIYCDVKNKKHVAFSASTASNTFLSKSRAGFEIENQLGELDLCPLFDNPEPAPINVGETIASNSVAVAIPTQTPGQIALNSLKIA